MGHICYYATSSSGEGETNKGAVFTGDTLVRPHMKWTCVVV